MMNIQSGMKALLTGNSLKRLEDPLAKSIKRTEESKKEKIDRRSAKEKVGLYLKSALNK